MAATPRQASLETSLTRLNDDGRALLFTEARTANTFSDRPVAGEQLEEIYELMKWGPTWSNTLPCESFTSLLQTERPGCFRTCSPGTSARRPSHWSTPSWPLTAPSTTRFPACFPSAPGCGTPSKQTQGCGTRSAPAAHGCRPPTSSSPSAQPAWPPDLWEGSTPQASMPSSSPPGTGGHSSSSTSATPVRAPGMNACPGWTMRKPSGMPNPLARPVPGPFLAPGRAYCRTAARKSHTAGQALQTSSAASCIDRSALRGGSERRVGLAIT